MKERLTGWLACCSRRSNFQNGSSSIKQVLLSLLQRASSTNPSQNVRRMLLVNESTGADNSLPFSLGFSQKSIRGSRRESRTIELDPFPLDTSIRLNNIDCQNTKSKRVFSDSITFSRYHGYLEINRLSNRILYNPHDKFIITDDATLYLWWNILCLTSNPQSRVSTTILCRLLPRLSYDKKLSPDFQTKGLRLPLRRALITAKESTSPRKFVYRCYLAPSPSSPSPLSISTTRLTYFASIFPGPISALSRLVPSRLSLHVCLNSSREIPLHCAPCSHLPLYVTPQSSPYSSLRPKISLHPCLPTGLCPRIGLSNARCVSCLSQDIAYDPEPINLV